MTEEFYRRFGQLELGPQDHPQYGKVLWERRGSALVKRYTLDSSGWSIDAQTQERAFRLGDDARVFLPSGQEIPRPGPLPAAKPDDTLQRLYGPPPPTKPGEMFAELRDAPTAQSTSVAPQSNIAERLFTAESRAR
jgi:hypothetical protein